MNSTLVQRLAAGERLKPAAHLTAIRLEHSITQLAALDRALHRMDALVETPKPSLARVLELVAAILDLQDGRLDLVYRPGRLEAWLVDGGLRQPPELGPLRRRGRPAARQDR